MRAGRRNRAIERRAGGTDGVGVQQEKLQARDVAEHPVDVRRRRFEDVHLGEETAVGPRVVVGGELLSSTNSQQGSPSTTMASPGHVSQPFLFI